MAGFHTDGLADKNEYQNNLEKSRFIISWSFHIANINKILLFDSTAKTLHKQTHPSRLISKGNCVMAKQTIHAVTP